MTPNGWLRATEQPAGRKQPSCASRAWRQGFALPPWSTGLVIGAGQTDEIELAADDQFCEVAGIPHLLAAEAARAQDPIIASQKGFLRQRAAKPN